MSEGDCRRSISPHCRVPVSSWVLLAPCATHGEQIGVRQIIPDKKRHSVLIHHHIKACCTTPLIIDAPPSGGDTWCSVRLFIRLFPWCSSGLWKSNASEYPRGRHSVGTLPHLFQKSHFHFPPVCSLNVFFLPLLLILVFFLHVLSCFLYHNQFIYFILFFSLMFLTLKYFQLCMILFFLPISSFLLLCLFSSTHFILHLINASVLNMINLPY